MTPSDIIAIIAIVLSAIVSVVSGYISYKTNKMNITAKRLEIAYQRRLDSFSKMISAMGEFQASLVDAVGIIQKDGLEATRTRLYESFENVVKTFDKERVFFPSKVNYAVNNYNKIALEHTDEFLKNPTPVELEKWRKSVWDEENKIVALMQEFINLE